MSYVLCILAEYWTSEATIGMTCAKCFWVMRGSEAFAKLRFIGAVGEEMEKAIGMTLAYILRDDRVSEAFA